MKKISMVVTVEVPDELTFAEAAATAQNQLNRVTRWHEAEVRSVSPWPPQSKKKKL